MKPRRQWLARIVGILAVLVMGDVIAERLNITYWSPIDDNQVLRVFTYLHDMPRADVIFLGTSRTRAAIIPAEIEERLSEMLRRDISAYCLAQNGSNAYTSWLILDDAVRTHGPPEVIVLELSPASLNSNHKNVARDLGCYSSLAEIVSGARWINTPDRLSAAASGCFRGVSSAALYGSRFLYADSVYDNLARYRLLKGAEFPQELKHQYQRPADPKPVRRLAQLDTAIRITRNDYMRDYKIGGAPEAGFLAMVDFAATRKIPLILVDPPLTPEYREAINTPEEFAEYRSRVDQVLRDPHSTLVEANPGDLHVTEKDFQDLTHLNPLGARRFSRHLAESVLLPLMGGRR